MLFSHTSVSPQDSLRKRASHVRACVIIPAPLLMNKEKPPLGRPTRRPSGSERLWNEESRRHQRRAWRFRRWPRCCPPRRILWSVRFDVLGSFGSRQRNTGGRQVAVWSVTTNGIEQRSNSSRTHGRSSDCRMSIRVTRHIEWSAFNRGSSVGDMKVMPVWMERCCQKSASRRGWTTPIAASRGGHGPSTSERPSQRRAESSRQQYQARIPGSNSTESVPIRRSLSGGFGPTPLAPAVRVR